MNIINLINEVEQNTDLAELKSEYEKTKFILEKVKTERDKIFNELNVRVIYGVIFVFRIPR